MNTQSIAARLDELIKRGVTQVGSFIPWQSAESDISHALIRFLQTASERQMNVFLILSPELGIHYPNSGLPKNLVGKKENFAAHFQAEKISVHLPPNSHALPSYFSAEFNKRYYSYLSRMDSLFHDLSRNQPSLMKRTSVGMSGSFWKYYRSSRVSTHSPFAGPAGDYSAPAALAFRERMEHLYSQREFSDPNAAAANRWKTRFMEETNRKWFYQHAEDVFRSRSQRALRKKSTDIKLSALEIFTPEADPAFTYSRFAQMVTGVSPDFAALSHYLDEATARVSYTEYSGNIPINLNGNLPKTPIRNPSQNGPQNLSQNLSQNLPQNLPMIHWSSVGSFRNLTDPEKQFLLLKSILLTATRGGGILIEDNDWLSFSQTFRSRVENLIRSLTHENEFHLKNPVLYLSPHLWSGAGVLWEQLYSKLGHQVRMISSIEGLLRERQAHLLVVDPNFVFTREAVQKLSAWAKAGRMLVLPRSPLFTEAARSELERSVANSKKIEITCGLSYAVHTFGNGTLVLYEIPSAISAKIESFSAFQTFVQSILSLAEIPTLFRVTDNRLNVVCFEIQKDGLATFILNSSKKAIQADIIFPTEVRITDLGSLFSQATGVPKTSPQENTSATTSRLTLNVPPMGILPLKVEGIDLAALREKQLAASNARELESNAHLAALSELPGLGAEGNIGELWS